MRIERVETEQQKQDAFAVRKSVFVDEQKFDEATEYDAYEDASTHVVGYDDSGMAVAAARFRPYKDKWKLERVCILKEARGRGWGVALMQELESFALEQHERPLYLHAQIQVVDFYMRLGFKPVGPQFLEEDYPHQAMMKEPNTCD
ncbi:MAG: GNAT family N-acetyltransferase [Bacilli bacterium]